MLDVEYTYIEDTGMNYATKKIPPMITFKSKAICSQ